MTAPIHSWTELDAELNPRLAAVGFRSAEFPAKPSEQDAGTIYGAYAAPYAVLFTIKLAGESSKQILSATSFACETMRAALTKSGANDWTRDGYVLLLLASAPLSPDSKQVVHTFEQSRSICRRHAVWPEPASANEAPTWTPRLDRVTVLALPPSEAPPAPSQLPPVGSKFLEDIHTRLEANSSYKLIAEELVQTAREQEDFHAP